MNPTVNLIKTELKFESTNPVNWGLLCENVGQCGSTTFKGVTYDFANLHFHTKSEHKLNGRQFPLESHMVHRAADGSLLVIATMFSFRSKNAYLSNITGGNDDDDDDDDDDNDDDDEDRKPFKSNPVLGSISKNVAAGYERFDVAVRGLIGNKGYCTYSGSLTTPPCTEGVTWLLALEEQPISSNQLNAYFISFNQSSFGNNHSIQPRHKRPVTCFVKSEDDEDRR